MARKVHLTFLWTDESVMLEDFATKVSKKMLEWANAFYAPYGIQLDAKPAPNIGTVALAHKFALVKNDGIQPDFGLADQIVQEFQTLREKNKQEQAALEREDLRIDSEIDATPAMDKPTLQRLRSEGRQVRQKLKVLSEKWLASFEDENAEAIRRDYDTQLRLQMSDKFMFDKIGGVDTLNVVFARFKYRQHRMMNPRYEGIVPGRTQMFPRSEAVVLDSKGKPRWIWPYTYVLIDIKQADPNTLAHEIVHAVGETHPLPVTVVKNLEKLLNYRPGKPEGSLLNQMLTKAMSALEYQSLFKVVPGGYFDGKTNDIMNYSTSLPDPSDYILADSDKKRFFNPAVPFITD